MTTLAIDDPAALDELSDRIEQSWKTTVSKTQWGVGRRKWLTAVKTVGSSLTQPEIPTIEQYQALLAERDDLSSALDLTELAWDAPEDRYWLVGVHRYDGAPVAFAAGKRLFSFVR